MNYLYINKEDVNLAWAKQMGVKWNLSVEHNENVPRGWMFFYVDGQIWGRQYVKTDAPVEQRRGPWVY